MDETSHHVKPPTIFDSLLHRERARLFRPLLVSPRTHKELGSAVRGSTFLVEKMKLYDKLSKHDGCVNSVLFSNCGDYIYTGSDDTHVHIYNTHTRKLLLDLPTAHVENIFFAKELSSSMPDWVLTCAADGQVLLTHAPTRMRKRVFHHEGRAHRIAHWPQSESSFFSCGEDGACCLFDMRDHVRSDGTCADYDACFPKLIIPFANAYGDSQSIFSIGVNPSNPNEIALAGESNAVSLYDVRKAYRPTGHLCPAAYQLSDESDTHITGIKYSPDGELLFASYSEGDVYSFWVKDHTRANRCQCEQEEPQDEESDDDESCPPLEGEEDDDDDDKEEEEESKEQNDEDEEESDRISRSSSKTGISSHSSTSSTSTSRGYYKRYHGHRNADTVKQVGCYGSRGEFVVSGSDCGHIFIWDTHTARLVKMLKADSIGAVNCISAHPTMPMLATSGLERDAKLWLPMGEHLPLVAGSKERAKAEQVMHNNATRPSRSSMMNQAMLRQLMMMLAGASGGRFVVPFPDDDSEGDEDEEERGFGEDSSSENSSEEPASEDDHDDYDDDDDEEEDDDDDDNEEEEEEVDFRGQRRTRDGDDDHESPHRPSRRRRSEGNSSSVPVPLIGVVTRRRSSSENEEDDDDDEDMPPLEWSGDEDTSESDED